MKNILNKAHALSQKQQHPDTCDNHDVVLKYLSLHLLYKHLRMFLLITNWMSNIEAVLSDMVV